MKFLVVLHQIQEVNTVKTEWGENKAKSPTPHPVTPQTCHKDLRNCAREQQGTTEAMAQVCRTLWK